MGADQITRQEQVLARWRHVIPVLNNHASGLKIVQVTPQRYNPRGGQKFLWRHAPWSLVGDVNPLGAQKPQDGRRDLGIRLRTSCSSVQWQIVPIGDLLA